MVNERLESQWSLRCWQFSGQIWRGSPMRAYNRSHENQKNSVIRKLFHLNLYSAGGWPLFSSWRGACLPPTIYPTQWDLKAVCPGIWWGRARTQSPTHKNDDVELPTFGVILGVSPPGVQWTGLTLEARPCWSPKPPVQVSMPLRAQSSSQIGPHGAFRLRGFPSFYNAERRWYFSNIKDKTPMTHCLHLPNELHFQKHFKSCFDILIRAFVFSVTHVILQGHLSAKKGTVHSEKRKNLRASASKTTKSPKLKSLFEYFSVRFRLIKLNLIEQQGYFEKLTSLYDCLPSLFLLYWGHKVLEDAICSQFIVLSSLIIQMTIWKIA